MADGLEITFEGMPEFSRMMQELAGPAAERIARHAVRAGAQVVQAAITEAAPVRPDLPSGTALPPGALKNDIEVKTRKEPDGSVSAYIAPGSRTRRIASWVEFGHRQIHGRISRKGGGILGGRLIDVPAHEFIRPAFEASEAAAQDAIAMDRAASFARGYQVIMPDDEPEQLGSGE
jgi:hypothetical protein